MVLEYDEAPLHPLDIALGNYLDLRDSDESLLSLDVDTDRERRQRQDTEPNMLIRGYTKFLTKFPYIIPIIVISLAVGCGVYSWKKHPPPDFSADPTKGFETRGTPIRARAWTLENLYKHRAKDLFLVPNATLMLQNLGFPPGSVNFTGLLALLNSKKRRKRSTDVQIEVEKMPDSADKDFSASRKKRFLDPRFMCSGDGIHDAQTKFVFEVVGEDADLLTAENLNSMCKIQEQHIMTYISPSDCPMKSVAFFIGQFFNVSCSSITDEHIQAIRDLMASCADHYYDRNLTIRTSFNQARAKKVPLTCIQKDNIISKMFYYLMPTDFMKDGDTESKKSESLKYSLSYLDPYATIKDQSNLDWKIFYERHLVGVHLSHNNVKVTAVNLPNHLSIKYDIFAEYLLHDTIYFIVAAVLIFVIMILYLKSVVLTLATILNVGVSFILAYTVYHAIPTINFFPFLNLLTALVLIAVGADDVFIFHDAWEQAKQEGNDDLPLDKVMAKTFSHAALSVFVTSLTTAAAFFANFVSTITAIQCFGIFAGIAILTNFILMVTWTPSVIVGIELVWRFVQKRCCNCQWKFMSVFTRASEVIYGKWLPTIIDKAWFAWIFILVGLGVGGCVVVFVNPKLRLPSTKDFQLFPSTNLLEHWNMAFEDKFQAVVDKSEKSQSQDIPLYFIWGFHPKDDGNHLDPDDRGSVVSYDKNFDFYSEESQIWLTSFCKNLTNSNFVQKYYKRAVCGLEAYGKMFRKYCNQWGTSTLSHMGPCCRQTSVPFDPEQLEKCGPAIEAIYDQNSRYGIIGEPIYNSENTVVGYKMYARSTFRMSMSFETMDGYYKKIQKFMDEQLETAPKGMKGMFFTGRYSFDMFYDLQRGISQGTYYSIVLSLGVAFIVMVMTSLNLLITLYAIITIGFAIICTVGTIVLMGWDLNILESITISLAVGLSIDFTIHYGVAYRLSGHKDSRSRVTEAFSRVGSAVAMAALTTFAAGAAMMPSQILAYTKLGIFLMLVMAFSWVYSTFLFQSICRIIGPRGNFCQMSLNCLLCRKPKPVRDSDRHSLASVDSNDSFLVTF